MHVKQKGVMMLRVYDPNKDGVLEAAQVGRLTKADFEITANKLLLGAGSGSDPTEVDLPAGGGLSIFGDGSDGDVVTAGGGAGDVTLSRDMFYDDFTVTAGDTITTGGYRIFVKGTLTNNETIERNGNDGSNGDGTQGLPGAALAAGSLGGSAAGGLGKRDIAGDAGGDITSSLGGDGGAGGAGSVGGAGAKGEVTAPSAAKGGFHAAPFSQVLKEIETAVAKIAGGAGGGGGGGEVGKSGGGGASGGGVLLIAAQTIVNSGAVITATGGAGGDGKSDGNCGGGGGGGGGVLVLIYNSLTTGTETANGGAGGAKYGTGVAGASGSNGTVIKIANA